MKRQVTFREYEPPTVDEEAGQSERGEFLSQWDESVEGTSLMDIADKADARAKELSEESDNDVRVFEIPV